MRVPRVKFTIGQLMILISVVGLLLGIAAWASWDPGVIILVADVSLIMLFSIGLQLYAILWRDTQCVTSHPNVTFDP
jgi:hypothetical protein